VPTARTCAGSPDPVPAADAGEAGRTAYSEAVFGRNKTLNEQQAETVTVAPREGAKNRPTPKRKDQEAANRRPLVVTDRKAARSIDRDKRREAQLKQRAAMATGDEAHLPARDKGPVRRYIRDYVDARYNLAEFMLPVMILVLALSFTGNATIFAFVSIAVYALLLAAAIDAFLTWRRLKAKLVAKFGADKVGRGLAMYAVMRTVQFRRSRMPRALAKRGEYPV